MDNINALTKNLQCSSFPETNPPPPTTPATTDLTRDDTDSKVAIAYDEPTEATNGSVIVIEELQPDATETAVKEDADSTSDKKKLENEKAAAALAEDADNLQAANLARMASIEEERQAFSRVKLPEEEEGQERLETQPLNVEEQKSAAAAEAGHQRIEEERQLWEAKHLKEMAEATRVAQRLLEEEGRVREEAIIQAKRLEEERQLLEAKRVKEEHEALEAARTQQLKEEQEKIREAAIMAKRLEEEKNRLEAIEARRLVEGHEMKEATEAVEAQRLKEEQEAKKVAHKRLAHEQKEKEQANHLEEESKKKKAENAKRRAFLKAERKAKEAEKAARKAEEAKQREEEARRSEAALLEKDTARPDEESHLMELSERLEKENGCIEAEKRRLRGQKKRKEAADAAEAALNEEPILELQNVTAMTRVLIPNDVGSKRPAPPDRNSNWSWTGFGNTITSTIAARNQRSRLHEEIAAMKDETSKSASDTPVATNSSLGDLKKQTSEENPADGVKTLPTETTNSTLGPPTSISPTFPAKPKDLTDIEKARLMASRMLLETSHINRSERPLEAEEKRESIKLGLMDWFGGQSAQTAS